MDEYTLVSSTQIPHIAKVTLSGVVGVPESKFRVIAPDVGGGFGSKLNVYAEEALAVGLAKKLGRPVKWIEERSENYVATIHGRGVTHECTIAGTEDGKILGVKFVEYADMGAYYQLLTPGDPRAGRLGVHGSVRARGVPLRVPWRAHELHAHRRLPRRGQARGHVRAWNAWWTCSPVGSARTRPMSDA